MPRRPFTKTQRRVCAYLVVGTASMLLWLVPTASGTSTPYNVAVFATWFALVSLLVADLYHRNRKRHIMLSTLYLEPASNRAFCMARGTFAYRGGCDLIDQASVILACCDPIDLQPATPPEDFAVETVIRTEVFRCKKAPREQGGVTPDNIDILQWQGRVETPADGTQQRFTCLAELEDLLCPLTATSAAALVGRCYDAGMPRCLVAPGSIAS